MVDKPFARLFRLGLESRAMIHAVGKRAQSCCKE